MQPLHPFWFYEGFFGILSLVPVTFRIEHFEGPLDLLLQLVEQEKLDISQLSLTRVADQFVEYVHNSGRIALDELADFLVVASKLVYMKSKLLLPDLTVDEMEEGPDLETQLRTYKAFVEASRAIDALWKSGQRSFPRSKPMVVKAEQGFRPPENFTVQHMQELMRRVIARLIPQQALPQAVIERIVTVQEKIGQLYRHIREKASGSFRHFVGEKASKQEAVATFLALLELVKQRFLVVTQGELFEDIAIVSHPEPPTTDPFAESFV
jgi:segregation and condensation protein A